MIPKTGRPIVGDAKREIIIYVRMSENEVQTLDECAEKMNSTRSGVVRHGIQLVKTKLDEKSKRPAALATVR